MASPNSNTNAWGKLAAAPVETVNFAEIMSEEYAYRVQDQEQKRYEKKMLERRKREEEDAALARCSAEAIQVETDGQPACSTYSSIAAAAATAAETQSTAADEKGEWEDCSALLLENEKADSGEHLVVPTELADYESDAVIAQMLQSQFDHEYNEELRRIEKQRNKHSKVTVTLDKYRRNGDLEFLHDTEDSYEEEDEMQSLKRDWDRFETNEKLLETIPKCGFKLDKEGEMITKHDPQLCGVRNACRIMSFPPEFPTGDGASFDMKLSNQVFNQLKTYSRRGKKNKMHDRKGNVTTAEMGVDAPTRLLLFKLINNQILEQINGVISTGKEAVILHANSDPTYAGTSSGYGGALLPPQLLPKECAIKIYKTTLNEFKQRDRYIKDDYRFKDRFSKQNNRVIINMWAEKEMHNIMRMQSVGINCPDVVVLKKHVLVMSFIGDNHNAAPKLKDARLSDAELCCAYEEIVAAMHKLYNDANLVHADLSEYNILWHNDKCWFIDVAQSVEPEHPSALEFLMRDCGNIINFFSKRGVPNIYTKEQLFEHITGLNAEAHNAAMLERIHTRGASIAEATAPNREQCPDELKPLEYPFDLAWEKSLVERQKAEQSMTPSIIDNAANAMQVLNTKCSVETRKERKEKKSTIPSTVNVNNTAKH